MYPCEVPEGCPIAQTIAEGIRVVLGKQPEYSYSHGAIDTGYLNVKGIEAVNFGAGNYKFLHTDTDVVSLEDAANAAKLYAYAAMAGVKG